MPYDRPNAAPVRRDGVLDYLAKAAHDAGSLVVDHLELAALEIQRAGKGIVRILIASVVITVLVASAWMALVAGVAIWATQAGIPLPWTLVLAGVVNLLAAVAIALWIRARFPDLMLTATMRQLRTDANAFIDETERNT